MVLDKMTRQKYLKGFVLICLGLLSMRYLTYLSSTELNFIFKNYLAIIPLQILALLYIAFYWRSRRIKIDSSRSVDMPN